VHGGPPAWGAGRSLPMSKLTPVEALRIQVLLDVALRKLEFLSSISQGTGSELTEFMGDEISRIIQEQRDLEKKYEELIALRSTLTGLSNKTKLKEVQAEILDVSHKLRESNKSLCRNLKENPNVQENLQKMQDERKRVQQWLEDLRTELDECSFQLLMTKVDEERKDQELLHEVKKKEREATGTVRSLETDLQKEYSEHEKESKQGTDEIKKLKEELQELKTRSAIETSFLEKKLRAKENATLRIFAQKEKALQEEYDHLKRMIHLEESVHEKIDEFMTHRLEELGVQTDQWKERAEREIQEMIDKRDKLREDRGKGLEERNKKEDRKREDMARLRTREEEQRNQVMMEKQRNEQEEQEKLAILQLQEEGRRYLQRVRDRLAAKKAKKGKKGKKKK
jgi:hypothetical protein